MLVILMMVPTGVMVEATQAAILLEIISTNKGTIEITMETITFWEILTQKLLGRLVIKLPEIKTEKDLLHQLTTIRMIKTY
jgi:hypothetical protein